MNAPRVLGIAGWSGSGKTTLIVKLIPLLRAIGLKVATIKHAHHEFDVDIPGKDSYEHRRAGASEVLVCSARRWVQIHELGDDREPQLGDLLGRLSPCDLALIEGFKGDRHPKMEVYRQANGRDAMHPTDQNIVGVASDLPFPDAQVPVVHLDDMSAITQLVLAAARPIEEVLRKLASTAHP